LLACHAINAVIISSKPNKTNRLRSTVSPNFFHIGTVLKAIKQGRQDTYENEIKGFG
jgi:hypothetical protein